MKKICYVDTCIWLNIFKKEIGPSRAIPFWKSAQTAIHSAFSSHYEIMASTIILKELEYKVGKNFRDIQRLFKQIPIYLEKTKREDYDFARILEKKHSYCIGFCDCLHIAIAKRKNAVLITRDKKLIEIARRYIEVKKPESFVC
ncbi:hypothetical protein CMO92_04220 [Candidatus Woesearchaeota archaeon]|nr:hypothetical protein [Candidatus Woesearchaeota archaeon]|tara:strand:+ start:86 stop:517 length:432 start_codon:yes stop_codon:yes gene_type:complete